MNTSALQWSILSTCLPGARVTVRELTASPQSRQRLLEMGLTPGTPVEVVRFAPLGDPLEIKVRGYYLSLRKSEASGIRVEGP